MGSETPQRYVIAKAPPIAEVEWPEGWSFEELGQTLTLERKWSRKAGVPLLIFGTIWMGVIFFIYREFLAGDEVPPVMYVIPAVHAIVGVALLYAAFGRLLNSTRITAEQGRLEVKHGPLPSRGSALVDVSEIESIETSMRKGGWRQDERGIEGLPETKRPRRPSSTESRVKNRHRGAWGVAGVGAPFQVSAKLRTGGEIWIARALPECEQAVFLEQRLEHVLRLRDDRALPWEVHSDD